MIFEFDEFELDEALFEIRYRGRRLDAQPKVLHLLLVLVRHHDRVVTSRELHAALWDGQVVGYTSLPKAVRGARRVLGECLVAQAAIRTVHGRGYQFAMPTRERATSAAAAPTFEPQPMASLSSHGKALLSLAAVIGYEFSLALLTASAKQSHERVRRWLDDALVAGILRRSCDGADRYVFTRAALRDELRDCIPPRELATFRHQVSVALAGDAA